jgi:hypothetical protein
MSNYSKKLLIKKDLGYRQAVKIFEMKALIAHQDYPVPNGAPIDVFSYPRTAAGYNSIFVTESKGSAPDKPLLLFDNSIEIIKSDLKMYQGVSHHQLPTLRYEENQGFFYNQPNPAFEKVVIICAQETSILPYTFRYCISGDFRQKNEKNWYEQIPRQDNKNNLFKGIQQTVIAISLLHEKINALTKNSVTQNGIHVIPLIVTNAKIFIRAYDASHRKEIIEVDWAIHQCERQGSEINPAAIRYVFIVNINKLETFIERYA